MAGVGKAVSTDRERDGSVVAVGDVFVSIDCANKAAYVGYEDESMIRWEEIHRAEGELLVEAARRTLLSHEGAIHDQRRFA